VRGYHVREQSRTPEPLTPTPLPRERGCTATFAEACVSLAGLAGALLGWRPAEFWKATPAELGAVLRAVVPAQAPGVSRGELDRMMERFPDG
jgi:uncharacterized phage protein (TIGR02216 family)